MHALTRALGISVFALGLLAVGTEAADKVRVVTTTTDLKALTEAVGGDLVEVDALARGSQNPHDLEVRPSLMVKVRRADLLVINGLELDQWAEVVVQGANNPRGYPRGAGARRRLRRESWSSRSPGPGWTAPWVTFTRWAIPTTPSIPGWRPTSPRTFSRVSCGSRPQHRAAFERSREQFLARLGQVMAKWAADLAPYKGTKVIVDHNMWPYFLTRFGLVQAGSVEERPGIPATPTHLTKLIAYMKEDKIKVIMAVPWADHKLAERIAQEAGAKVVLVANGVGALKGTDTYLDTIDYNVKAVAQALK